MKHVKLLRVSITIVNDVCNSTRIVISIRTAPFIVSFWAQLETVYILIKPLLRIQARRGGAQNCGRMALEQADLNLRPQLERSVSDAPKEANGLGQDPRLVWTRVRLALRFKNSN